MGHVVNPLSSTLAITSGNSLTLRPIFLTLKNTIRILVQTLIDYLSISPLIYPIQLPLLRSRPNFQLPPLLHPSFLLPNLHNHSLPPCLPQHRPLRSTNLLTLMGQKPSMRPGRLNVTSSISLMQKTSTPLKRR